MSSTTSLGRLGDPTGWVLIKVRRYPSLAGTRNACCRWPPSQVSAHTSDGGGLPFTRPRGSWLPPLISISEVAAVAAVAAVALAAWDFWLLAARAGSRRHQPPLEFFAVHVPALTSSLPRRCVSQVSDLPREIDGLIRCLGFRRRPSPSRLTPLHLARVARASHPDEEEELNATVSLNQSACQPGQYATQPATQSRLTNSSLSQVAGFSLDQLLLCRLITIHRTHIRLASPKRTVFG